MAGREALAAGRGPPALTALSWDIQAYGVHAARVLLDMIDGRSPGSHQEGAARLVVRGEHHGTAAGLTG